MEVEVYETNSTAGGKLTSIEQDGFRWDAGPSLFTRPDLVTDLFEMFGVDPSIKFPYKRKEIVCNYFWEDGTTFSVPASSQDFTRKASKAFGIKSKVLEDYLKASQKKYELTQPVFLDRSLHRLSTYLSWDTLKALLASYQLNINTSLDQHNKSVLQHPKLVQMFNRYATYNGSSPFQTSGIMSLIPHLELGQGTFFPQGGMININRRLYELAVAQGVHFHFNSPVDKIEVKEKHAKGICVGDQFIPADVVVSNMDIYPTFRKLLSDQPQPEKILNQERSSSALIFYWGIKKKFPQLDLHNILFSNDYRSEFEEIFGRQNIFADPTIYINISSKEEPADAPEGCENWFVMINTPGDFGQDWDQLISEAKTNILAKVKRLLGEDVSRLIISEALLDPLAIQRKTSSFRGALYGASSNSKFAAFWRHPNFSRKIKNLYFCGGSVHPGGGIPLCISSARIVADLVQKNIK